MKTASGISESVHYNIGLVTRTRCTSQPSTDNIRMPGWNWQLPGPVATPRTIPGSSSTQGTAQGQHKPCQSLCSLAVCQGLRQCLQVQSQVCPPSALLQRVCASAMLLSSLPVIPKTDVYY